MKTYKFPKDVNISNDFGISPVNWLFSKFLGIQNLRIFKIKMVLKYTISTAIVAQRVQGFHHLIDYLTCFFKGLVISFNV